MSNEEVGKFIKLICLQHQFGHLTKSDLTQFVKPEETKIWQRFEEIDGKFYHIKTKLESERRKNFSDSRRKNRQSTDTQSKEKNICETSVEHMETETETITKTLTKLEGGVGGDFNWESVKQYFLNADEWMYKFCTSKGVSRETLVLRMNEFLNDIELRNEYKPLKDLQSHFTNWYNKSSKIKTKTNDKFDKYRKNERGAQQLLELLRSERETNTD